MLIKILGPRQKTNIMQYFCLVILCINVYRIAKEFIIKKMSSKELKQNSLLELYLSNKELDLKDVLGMTVDMLLAGIDTVWKNFEMVISIVLWLFP